MTTVIYLDHDPFNEPSDPEQDLYSDDEQESEASKPSMHLDDQADKPSFIREASWFPSDTPVNPGDPVIDVPHSAIIVKDCDALRERVTIENQGDEPQSLSGWYVKNMSSGKTCAPFGDIVIAPGDEIVLWTAPAMANSEAPSEDDEHNIFWRNKGNQKVRRLPVLNNKSGDGIELFNSEDLMVAFTRAE